MPIYSKDIDPWVPLHSSIGSGPRGNGFYVSSVIYTSTNTDIYSVYVGSLQGPDVEDVHDGDLIAFKSKFGEMTFYHIGVVTSRSSSYLTVRSVLRSDEWSVDQLQMKNDWEELKVLVDTAIDNAESATDDMNDLIDQIRETLEGGGFKGDKGDKGDAFVFEDFTDAQLLDLRRDVSSIYYRRVSNVYITDDGDKTGNVAIPLDASVFDSSTMLFVFVNGLLCGTNEYTVLADGTVVRFNHAFSVSGTRIDFIGIKAIAITAEDYDALKGDPAPASEVSAAVAAYLQSHPELVFVGATSSADGMDGLVPGPTIWARNAALFGDGTWNRLDITNDPTVTTGYSIKLNRETESTTETLGSLTIPVATSSAVGMMSAEDKAKLDGIETGANKINLQFRLLSGGLQWAEISKDISGGRLVIPVADLDSNHLIREKNLPEISEEKIADNAITSSKLASSSVTSEKLASNSVTTAKITDGSVTTLKLADVSVTTEKLANSSVTAFKIRDGVITDDKLIQSGGVLSRVSALEDKTRLVTQATNGLMSAADKTKLDSMGDGTIPAGSITTPKLADSAIITQKIADNAVTVDKLADNVVDSIKSDIQPTIDAAQNATTAANDAAALAMRAAANMWNAGNVLYGSLTGEIVSADDAWAVPAKSVDVYGKSTQVQTTGKNLLSYDSEDWLRVSGFGGTPTTRLVYAFPLAEGESIHWHRNTTGGIAFITGWMDDPEDASTYVAVATITNYANYTFTGNGTHPYLAFTVSTTLDFSTLPIREAQVESGTEFTSYEPWSGGAASPRPDWPQEIVSVDEVTLNIRGKNLFGGQALHDVLMGISGASEGTDQYGNVIAVGAAGLSNVPLFNVPFKPSTQYTLILRLAKHSGNTNANIRVNYTNNTYEYVYLPNSFTVDVPYVVALTTASGKTVKEVVGVNASANTLFYYDQCGIFEGVLTADQFEPYTGQSVQVLDQPIRSLPDGTEDKLTLSYIGPSEREGWGVYDAELVQRVGLNTLANASSWSKDSGDAHVLISEYVSDMAMDSHQSGKLIMCGKLSAETARGYGQVSSMADDSICKRGTLNKMFVKTRVEYASVNDFLSALGDATFYYPLATPITHDLGTIELPVNPAPDLTAWADGGSAQPTMSMVYEQDINIVIGELRSAIADMATS